MYLISLKFEPNCNAQVGKGAESRAVVITQKALMEKYWFRQVNMYSVHYLYGHINHQRGAIKQKCRKTV